MNRLYYLILPSFLILFTYCSPKTGTKTTETETKQMSQDNAFRATPPSPGPAPKIQMGRYIKFGMPNGLQVIVVENNKLPVVSMQLFVDVPPIIQGEFAGYTDFAGELLNKGTKKRSKQQLDEAIDFMGAQLSTNSNGIFGSSLKKHTDSLAMLMSEVLLQPAFPVDEFDKLKKRTLSGLAAAKDNPNAIAGNVARVLRYGKTHPYGEITTEATVEKITVDKSKEYYNTYFRPNISYLVIVGDMNVIQARNLATKYFGAWEQKAVPAVPNLYPSFSTERTVDFVNKPGAVQSVINITYALDYKPTASDRVAASIMNEMLGGFFRSRINQKLREEKAYTYGAGSRLVSDKYVGYFTTSGSFRNEVTDSAIHDLLYEIGRIRREKLSDEELALVKSVTSGNFARSLESPQTVANFALSIARYGLPNDFYDTYLEKIAAVTADDVLAVSAKYLSVDNAHILVVGNKEAVAEPLAKYATSGKVNYYDIYGNPIDDDQLKVPANLTAAEIINKNIEAIGGKAKLNALKTVKILGSADFSGFNLAMATLYQLPDKMSMEITAQGQVFNTTIVNGDKAKVGQMGQFKLLEGDAASSTVNQAILFPELYVGRSDMKAEIKGMEIVEGRKTYIVDIMKNDQSTGLHYYDVETGMKLRTVVSELSGDEVITQTIDYSDYKAINGIKFPFATKLSGGGMPMPLVMKATSVETNIKIEDAAFKLD